MRKLIGGLVAATALITLAAGRASAEGELTVTYSGATCAAGHRSDLIVTVTNGTDTAAKINVAGWYKAYGTTINAGDTQTFDFPADYPLYQVTVTGHQPKSFTWPACPQPTTTTETAAQALMPEPIVTTVTPSTTVALPVVSATVVTPAPRPAPARTAVRSAKAPVVAVEVDWWTIGS